MFEPILAALNENGIRYVVVGGVAVVLQGYARLTADLDLAVDLSPGPALSTIETLTELGFSPSVPVDPRGFADPGVRARWVSDKHMRVLSMSDPKDPLHQVDLFVENPIAFEQLWSRSRDVQLETTAVKVASIPDLIEMKELAGRPQDLADIEALRLILDEGESDE